MWASRTEGQLTLAAGLDCRTVCYFSASASNKRSTLCAEQGVVVHMRALVGTHSGPSSAGNEQREDTDCLPTPAYFSGSCSGGHCAAQHCITVMLLA